MNLTTKNAWILTGGLAALFAVAYVGYFMPQYAEAAKLRKNAEEADRKIAGEWVHPGAVSYDTVDAEISNRTKQAYEDINQIFNVPVVYQAAQGGNASNYFGNQVDALKKNPATKGLLKETKLGFDRLDPDNKYPVELKLRHLAMIDRLAKAAGAADLQEVLEFTQTQAVEAQPGDEAAGPGVGTRGRRPGMGGETAGSGAAAPVEAAGVGDNEIRLARVTLSFKVRGREADLIKFLALIQTPSKNPSELTLVYLNSAALSTNEKSFGALDGDITVMAIFPLKGADLKRVLDQQGAAGLTIFK